MAIITLTGTVISSGRKGVVIEDVVDKQRYKLRPNANYYKGRIMRIHGVLKRTAKVPLIEPVMGAI